MLEEGETILLWNGFTTLHNGQVSSLITREGDFVDGSELMCEITKVQPPGNGASRGRTRTSVLLHHLWLDGFRV